MNKKICIQCNKEFLTKNKNAKFCSRSCSISNRNKQTSHEEVEIVCVFCKKTFYVEYKKRCRKFCSKECFNLFQKDEILSIENRKNKSLGHMGIEPFNKNKKLEEMFSIEKAQEIKTKISESAKKLWKNEEFRFKQINAEYHQSEEYRKKLSDSLKKRYSLNKSPLIGKKLTEEHKKNIKIASKKPNFGMKNKIHSTSARKKMSIAKKGKIRKQSPEEKLNRRLMMIKKIEERFSKGFQMIPNWNPKACVFFEEYDKMNDTKGQYATNGGEFFIKELGYWVDYINHDLKLIIEYDEKKHYDVNGNLKEKDILRENEIKKYFKDYEFIRIKDHDI